VAELVAEPAGAQEMAALVEYCQHQGLSVAALGACRTLGYLRATPVVVGIALSRMARVLAFEPDDLTVTVQPGITMAALDEVLASRRQYLPLDPPQPAQTTLGAVLATARTGPLRLSAGTPRDYVLGIEFVGHGGRLVRAGGRVVKNVAGYDMMKLMVGAYGSLGIISEVTLKIRPRPASQALVLLSGPAAPELCELGFALHDRLPLLYLDLLSPRVELAEAPRQGYALIAGLGGNDAEVEAQLATVRELAPKARIWQDNEAARLYRALVNLELPAASIALQLAVPPHSLPDCLTGGLQFRAHLGSGVAQMALAGEGTSAIAGAAQLRARAAQAGGHARVLRLNLDRELRSQVPCFDLPAPGAMAVMERLKRSFDPAAIFNPGCFVGGL
jgi:glycolate oxidase FAD binding subunit